MEVYVPLCYSWEGKEIMLKNWSVTWSPTARCVMNTCSTVTNTDFQHVLQWLIFLPWQSIKTPNPAACGKFWMINPLAVEKIKRNWYWDIFFPIFFQKKIVFLFTIGSENIFQTIKMHNESIKKPHIVWMLPWGTHIKATLSREECVELLQVTASMWPWSRDWMCSLQRGQRRKLHRLLRAWIYQNPVSFGRFISNNLIWFGLTSLFYILRLFQFSSLSGNSVTLMGKWWREWFKFSG